AAAPTRAAAVPDDQGRPIAGARQQSNSCRAAGRGTRCRDLGRPRQAHFSPRRQVGSRRRADARHEPVARGWLLEGGPRRSRRCRWVAGRRAGPNGAPMSVSTDMLEPRRVFIARWFGAAILILAAHIGCTALAVMRWHEQEVADAAAGAMLVDMVPAPAVPVDSPDVAHGPLV